MPIETGTLANNIQSTEQSIKSYQTGGAPLLRKTVLPILAKVWGLAVYGLKVNAKNHLENNLFLVTADLETLIQKGAERGVTQKTPTLAKGRVGFTFTGKGLIPVGTKLKREDGKLYVLLQEVSRLSAGTVTAEVESEEAGTALNLEVGNAIDLIVPKDFISSISIVENIDGGQDLEEVEFFRQRVIAAKINDSIAAGTEDYYKDIAEAVPGVDKSYPLGGVKFSEPFCNGVTIVCEGAGGTSVSDGVLADVVSAIQNHSESQLRSVEQIFAETIHPIMVDLNISITPNTVSTQNEVESLLRDFFLAKGFREKVTEAEILAVLSTSSVTSHRVNSITYKEEVVTEIIPEYYDRPVLGGVQY